MLSFCFYDTMTSDNFDIFQALGVTPFLSTYNEVYFQFDVQTNHIRLLDIKLKVWIKKIKMIKMISLNF